eukprot:12108245-Ditylum_brightwellii.AAC.1
MPMFKKNLSNVAAENSLQPTVSYLLTVASTHFIEGKMPQKHPAKKLKGTHGAQKLFKMVSKAARKLKNGKKE